MILWICNVGYGNPPILGIENPKIKVPCPNESVAGLGEVGLVGFQEKRRCPSIVDHNQQPAGPTSPTYHFGAEKGAQQDDMLENQPICVKTVTFSSLTNLAVISVVVDITAANGEIL